MRKLALGSLVVAVLFALVPPGASADVRFELKGQWTCKDGTAAAKPLAGARVELFRSRSFWKDEKITTRHTGTDGRYSIPVKASGNFDLYIKVLLHDDDGVELENWYSPFTWETTTSTRRSRSGTVDLGTWQIAKSGGGAGSPKCAIWQGARNAYKDYQQVVGARPPSSRIKVEAEFPCCGSPFATRDTIRWPGSKTVGGGAYPSSFHEFAHTVRHSFDGNFAHFTFDAGRFLYPQNHTPCKVTNQGFAFNEGWAEYWADSFSPAPCAGSENNLSQEGNVAARLKQLQACSNRQSMVRVLRESAGRIHSFDEFKARFDQILGPRSCGTPVTRVVTGAEPVLSPAQQTADVQAQIRAQQSLVASLNRQAAAAQRRARNPGKCTKGGCGAALERLIAPSALSAQAAQAKLVLGQLEDGLAAARKISFDPSQELNVTQALIADRDAFEKANQKILIAGLQKGLREIKTEPGFNRGERSELFKTMDKRADGLARARKRGQETPASVQSLFAAPASPTEGAKKVR